MNFTENETFQIDPKLAKLWSQIEIEANNSQVSLDRNVKCVWMECCKNVYNDTYPRAVRINRTQYLISNFKNCTFSFFNYGRLHRNHR